MAAQRLRSTGSWVLLGLITAASGWGQGPPQTVSPGGPRLESIQTGCPTFSWSQVAPADAYELVVYQQMDDGEQVETLRHSGIPGGAGTWTPPTSECLRAGAVYGWQIRALSSEGDEAWSKPAFFEIARPSRREVSDALDTLRRYLDGAVPTPREVTATSSLQAASPPSEPPNPRQPGAQPPPSSHAPAPLMVAKPSPLLAGASGIRAVQSDPSGFTAGVYGEADSTQGSGVYGYVAATTGLTAGVYGVTNSNQGYGVRGATLATSGVAIGVGGTSGSTQGRGVFGAVDNSSGATLGVFGQAASTEGAGVSGYALATTGNTQGVLGQSVSPQGAGVLGQGFGVGVRGEANASDAMGVLGINDATTGDTPALQGETKSTAGVAVFGTATATTGSTVGVWGSVASPYGLAGRFDGDVDVSGNLEVLGRISGTELILLSPVSYAPFICVPSAIGAIYFDSEDDEPCVCRSGGAITGLISGTACSAGVAAAR